MNCKPGDLARIVGNSAVVIGLTQDRFVTVLHRPIVDSMGGCVLPDGSYSDSSHADNWVIEFPSPIIIKRFSGALSETRYAVCPDRRLRPIRPDGITDSEVSELFSPSPAKESEKV